MPTHSPTAEQQPGPILVQAFFSEAADAFRDLVTGPGASWTSHLHQFTRDSVETTTPDRLTGFFVAACEFETPELSGEITFGDREYLINTVVGPRGRHSRYGLWEWADALDRPTLVPVDTSMVFQRDRVGEIVRGMATALRELRSAIARGAPNVIERMDHARARVRAEDRDRWREAEHRAVVVRANDAFRQRRWDRVVDLLESVADRLSPAELEKLTYARKQSSSP